jgi:hypothetical protein
MRWRNPRPVGWRSFFRTRPRLEALEARWLPAMFQPTIFTDGGPGSGSLRDVVLQANADTGTADDTILLQAGTYSLTIQNTAGHETAGLQGDLNITSTAHKLIIQGAGSSGSSVTTIDASALQDRAFQIVNAGTQVVFENLVIQGGLAQGDGTAGAAAGSTDALGGGILNDGGNVTLTNVILQTNTARAGAGSKGANGTTHHAMGFAGSGGHNALGGGIYSTGGTLTISGGSLVGNQALGGAGGSGGDANALIPSGPGGAGGPGGNGQGGALAALASTVSLTNATLQGGNATGGTGGNGGMGGLDTCHVCGAPPPGGGGAGGNGQGGSLYINGGSLQITTTTFSQNGASGGNSGTGFSQSGGPGGSGQGGGLFALEVNATLTSVTMTMGNLRAGAGANTATASGVPRGAVQGGGVYVSGGSMTITTSTITSNGLIAGAGTAGSPAAGGTEPFSGYPGNPGGDAQGGGVFGLNTTLTLTSSTIATNAALAGPGGAGGTGNALAGPGGAGGAAGAAQGGGVYLSGATTTLTITTISTNAVSGGNGGVGGNAGVDPGFSAAGGPGGSGGAGAGGGIYLSQGSLILTNDSINGNQATSGTGGAGGAGSGSGAKGQAGANPLSTGGGVNNPGSGTVNALNSLFAYNSAQSAPAFAGTFASASHNLLDDGTGSGLSPANPDANGNLVGTTGALLDPLLGPLANNGGPTETQALAFGSPAINAGTAAGAPTTDQRGDLRDAYPDIGAFEFQASAAPLLSATGAGAGGGPQVNVYNAQTGSLLYAFYAYTPAFTGGVRVAVADVNGDGIPDIITAPGPGGGPDIRVFDGARLSQASPSGDITREFLAYSVAFTGGVYVAAGDVNHDGFADIITGPDSGGGPEVKVFSGKDNSVLSDFMAYNSGFSGGVRLAAGDVNGDGFADLITAPGPGGGPDIRVFSGAAGVNTQPAMIGEFLAYDYHFNTGVFVAAGDINSDGKADIVTSPDQGGGPDVRVFEGAAISLSNPNPAPIQEFLAYDYFFEGGVRVGVMDVNGVSEIVTIPGPTGGSDVRIFNALTTTQLDEFLAYPGFLGGSYVGGL